MQASSGVNCDETYPLRSVPIAFCLRRFPDGRSGNLEPSTAHHAQQIVEFEEGVFEAAEETTKEDEKRAEEIAEKSGEAPQKVALRAATRFACPRKKKYCLGECTGCGKTQFLGRGEKWIAPGYPRNDPRGLTDCFPSRKFRPFAIHSEFFRSLCSHLEAVRNHKRKLARAKAIIRANPDLSVQKLIEKLEEADIKRERDWVLKTVARIQLEGGKGKSAETGKSLR